jgi:hypothetical protein
VSLALVALLARAHADDLLHVGNSYTFFNDLELVTRGLLAQADAERWSEGRTVRLADGGLRFVDHLDRAGQAGTAWNTALAGTDTWDWVVLQEQSQIPGFPQDQSDFRASRRAAADLDDRVETAGARTVFLLTWGRRLGDESNRERFPDFATMQAALTEGYLAYRDATSTEARPTWIAPAGPAFARVHADVLAAGEDPLAPGSRFSRLYTEDGSHPSPLGTYLAACVLTGTITGRRTTGLASIPGVPPEDAGWLQTTADATVRDAALPFTYPWTDAPPQDSGTDTATGDSGPEAAAPDDTAAQAGDSAPDCGCGSEGPRHSAAPFTLVLATFGIFASRRRSRDTGTGKTRPRP